MKIIDRKDGEIIVSYSEDEFEFTRGAVVQMRAYKSLFHNKKVSVSMYIGFLSEFEDFIKTVRDEK